MLTATFLQWKGFGMQSGTGEECCPSTYGEFSVLVMNFTIITTLYNECVDKTMKCSLFHCLLKMECHPL